MSVLARLVVEIVGDTGQLVSSLDAADRRLGKTEGSVEKLTTKLSNMRPQLLAIEAGLLAGGLASVKFSSNLEEAGSAAEQTFKSAFDQVERFATGSASAFNISERAAFEYTATLGGIFNASKLTREESASLSITMTKLAADLASFKNLELDEALRKIQSGLVGEAEPLRSVGVLLSADAVAAKALELGLGGVNKELSEGEKVQARAALILEQLADAQGDVERTASSYANTIRDVAENTEEAAAAWGEALAPQVQKGAAALAAGAQMIAGVPEPVIAAAAGIGALALGFTTLGLVIPPFVAGAQGATRAAQASASASVSAATGTRAWTAATREWLVYGNQMYGTRGAIAAGIGRLQTLQGLLPAVAIGAGVLATQTDNAALKIGSATVAAGAMGAVLGGPVVGAIAAVATASDQILRQTSGHGLVDWLFRDPKSADAAAAAIRKVQNELAGLSKRENFDQTFTPLETYFGAIEDQAANLEYARRQVLERVQQNAQLPLGQRQSAGEFKDLERASEASIKALADELSKADVPFALIKLRVDRLDEAGKKLFIESFPEYREQVGRMLVEAEALDQQMVDDAKAIVRAGDALTEGIEPLDLYGNALERLINRLQRFTPEMIAAAEAASLMATIAAAGPNIENIDLDRIIASAIDRVAQSEAERATFEGLRDSILREAGVGGDDSGGGAGGGAARTPVDRAANATVATAQRRLDALAEAQFSGGDSAVSKLQAEFDRIDQEFEAFIPKLRALGVEVPEEFLAMFERIKRTAKEQTSDLEGLLGFLYARDLGRRDDLATGLVRSSSPSLTSTSGTSVRIDTINITPDRSVPGGIDVEKGVDVVRQSFADVS